MAAPIPEVLTGEYERDAYARIGTIYETQSVGADEAEYKRQFLRALNALARQLES